MAPHTCPAGRRHTPPRRAQVAVASWFCCQTVSNKSTVALILAPKSRTPWGQQIYTYKLSAATQIRTFLGPHFSESSEGRGGGGSSSDIPSSCNMLNDRWTAGLHTVAPKKGAGTASQMCYGWYLAGSRFGDPDHPKRGPFSGLAFRPPC